MAGKAGDDDTATYALADLPSTAPWVARQVQLLGPDEVRAKLRRAGVDPERRHRMAVWVEAISRRCDPLWPVLES